MNRKKSKLLLPVIVLLVLSSAACTDLTSPDAADSPAPSFSQGQGGEN